MLRTLVSAALFLLLLFHDASHSATRRFFVSTSGSDAWSGALAAPNGARTDGPFATLAHAIEAVKKASSSDSSLSCTIDVRKGTYELSEPLLLSRLSHLRVRPYRNEPVTISGSVPLRIWKPVADPAIRALIPPSLRDSVYEIDLKENGILSAGDVTPKGGLSIDVFLGGESAPLVRYPKEGWLAIADVPQTGDSLYNKGLEREKRYNNVPVGRHYGRIAYAEDRISQWSGRNELFMQGYWTWDWSDSYQKVARVMPGQHEIEIQKPHHNYGYTKNQRYCFYNIIEELARPGEWCIDRAKGMLYLYLPKAVLEGREALRASRLDRPMITMEGCADVMIEGFTLTQSRNSGVVIKGGSQCEVRKCRLSNLGATAVVIEGGTKNGIRSCDLYNLALAAVTLQGGDRATLTPGGNFCDDNHIHHYSRRLHTGQYAVNLSGVGNLVSHNLIHDAPFEAIYLSGNDHTVEFNEIHHVTQETGDAGALHTGRDWTWRGNRIQYNYFHHLQGAGLHGVMGVYLDDWASGFIVRGNVFYKAGRATLIGGGRDNVVENNVYIECAPSIHIDARGLGWGSYYFDGTYPDLFTKMDAMQYAKPPYSTRYPELLALYKDDPAVPKHNIIRKNVSYGGRFMDVYDYRAFDLSLVTIKDNVIADTAVMRRRAPGQTGWDPYYLNIDRKEGYELMLASDSSIRRELKGNVFVEGNPGIRRAEGGKFRIDAASAALRKAGIESIPFAKIGLRRRE